MVTVLGNVVEFRFYHPVARQVFLVGDFNGWRQGELAMTRETSGYWRATLRLPAGDFRFRYCADGDWYPDYAAFGLDLAPDGPDSIIRIGPELAPRMPRAPMPPGPQHPDARAPLPPPFLARRARDSRLEP